MQVITSTGSNQIKPLDQFQKAGLSMAEFALKLKAVATVI
jgi:hypothetical protein